MKHNLTKIHTKENSFLVEIGLIPIKGEWVIDGDAIFPLADTIEGGLDGMYPIIASTIEIDPSVPLYRPEDLKVEERYYVWETNEIYSHQYTILDRNYELENPLSKKGLFHSNEEAQDYCNFLNRQHEVVDVEAVIKSDIRACLSDFGIYDESMVNDKYETSRSMSEIYHRGRLNGYNAAPKHGWSDEDMRKAFDAGYDRAYGESQCDLHDLGDAYMLKFPSKKEYLQSLKTQPRTITLEYDEKPEVGDDGYIIVK